MCYDKQNGRTAQDFRPFGRVRLASRLALGLTALLTPLHAGAAEPATIELAMAAQQADAIAVYQVGDPPSTVIAVPVPVPKGQAAVPAFQRYVRHLERKQLVWGRPPQSLRVDEPHWLAHLQAHKRCQLEKICHELEEISYVSTLAHEPKPGDQVLVLLRKLPGNHWELLADRAMDSADRVPELKALLAKRGKHN